MTQPGPDLSFVHNRYKEFNAGGPDAAAGIPVINPWAAPKLRH
jgi:hypothetical protein